MKQFAILLLMFLSCLHSNAKKNFATAVKELSAMYSLPYKTEGITIDSCIATKDGLVYKCHVDIKSREYKYWQLSQRQEQIKESKKTLKQKRLEMIDRKNRSFLYKDKHFLLYKDFRKAYADSARTYINDNRLGKYLIDRMTVCFIIYRSRKEETANKLLCAFSLDMNDIDGGFVKEYRYKQFFIPKK